jgi:hypothetical protein
MLADDTDPRAPVTLFTFFLELSRALPVQSGAMHISYVDRDEEWSGWTDADVAGLLGVTEVEEIPTGSVPHTSMVVRHLTEPEPAPLSRVEAVFGDWGMRGLIPTDTVNRPGVEPEPGRATIAVAKSVVALTRFVPQDAHPPGREMTVGALHRIMFDGLVHLNALLEPLGFVAGRWEIGALTLADVPPEVAVLVDNTGAPPDEQRTVVAFVTEVHDGYPVPADDLEEDGKIAREAIGYHGGAQDGGQPFLQVLRFIHAAEGERLVGDHTRALVDLNTAVELLIRFVLYYGHAITGVPEETAWEANQASLKQKVRHYLPELLGREIDLENPDGPWGAWFGDGYMLRNRAVHEGELLDYDAVERAFEQASALIDDLKTSLMANEQLRKLGEQIEVEPHPPDERIKDALLNIEFPWD